jgi:hypothetical protein
MICRFWFFLIIFVSSLLNVFEMNVNVEIGFEQLLYLVKQLPAKQKKQLVEAIQKVETKSPLSPNNLQKLLLTGPVWTEEEYQNVLKTREQMNQLAENGLN